MEKKMGKVTSSAEADVGLGVLCKVMPGRFNPGEQLRAGAKQGIPSGSEERGSRSVELAGKELILKSAYNGTMCHEQLMEYLAASKCKFIGVKFDF